jgi:hypothetical protein
MARERPTRRPPLIRHWTPEEDALLLDMLHKGKPLGSIAVKFKRSISAIYARKAMLQRGAISTEPKRPTESP